MFRPFLRLGRLLVVSRSTKRIRGGLIFLVRNFFVAAVVVLTAEMLLLFLGSLGFCLPMTGEMRDLLARLSM